MFAVLTLAACGDNLPAVGPPLERADTMFVIAHFDDDMIFMQPELATALGYGSVTTVYVTSGDPVRGQAHAEHTFEAARIAYEHAAGASDWDCGYIAIAGLPAHHCRLLGRPVSMIGLDVPDGGRHGQYESLLNLVENTVTSLPILGPLGGRVTTDSLVAEIAEIIRETRPGELHVLDYASVHGLDHVGHVMSASFALWGAARAGYAGTIVSHRGYNVADEPPNMSDSDFAFTKPMLGYFEACYFGCAPCGTECPVLEMSHDTWLRRQYASIAVPTTTAGALESVATAGACLAATGNGAIGLADCAAPTALRLEGDRHLHAGDLCVSSGGGNDDPIALVPCADHPAQYWVFDDEGFVWNGRPPASAQGLDFDHMRCLFADRTAGAGAPLCGDHLRSCWRRHPR